MLHTETVNPRLLALLKALMENPVFDGFALAGGTSLALQIGHRESIDIDLFGAQEIEETSIMAAYSEIGQATKIKRSPNILICSVSGIKVDLVNYHYSLLHKVLNIDGLRLLSPADIGAMKLNAIAGRGSRKDFIDLFFLLQIFSLEQLLDFYRQKYRDGSEFLVLKSLTYFDDSDSDVEPRMIKPVEWSAIKQHILSVVNI